MELFEYDLDLTIIAMKSWKHRYIKKVKRENPDISDKELFKKVRNARAEKDFSEDIERLKKEYDEYSMR